MSYPRLEVDLDKVTANAERIVNLADSEDIEIIGVTKSVCADIKIAEAMLAGGVDGLADSRIKNLKYMQENLVSPDIPLMLLRIPMISEVDRVVEYADISLNSELEVIKALDQVAKEMNQKHRIILMVDVGDRREGVMPEDVIDIAAEILDLENIELTGLGTNLACFGGVLPSENNMQLLIDLKNEINNKFGVNIQQISGGNSSSLPRLRNKGLPDEITQLRVGETILLGSNVIDRSPFPDTYQETFLLAAEVIEVKKKPVQPEGRRGQNAFGERRKITKTGVRRRAILGIGRQDIKMKGLTPLAEDIEIEEASSDHLIIDVTDYEAGIEVGDILKFKLNYGALLNAATSQYVDISYISSN
ncbi:alanine racemase [Acetohalobium arabaticum]|uniref:Alanine racemase domain protein n=1 Tax=Acetohalobium arabaticum (strain ATCC 49924 / DSM 5501 / Z-7288) TaxID=574087 RepID=D9QRT1_ACEAZ|nr:alanine/ornithine racemase family PLP-dependent enzyme [Acetohalobium arabaticum]ADL13222.1 alanine racemase domain protein [Acetohalobium arabaticum DSM 5501]